MKKVFICKQPSTPKPVPPETQIGTASEKPPTPKPVPPTPQPTIRSNEQNKKK
jgi:hypothetical protein